MAKKKNTARKQAPESTPDTAPESHEHGDSRIFDDPTIQQTVTEDPLFVFLKKWWRQLVGVAVTVFVVMYARDAFRETYVTNMQRAADIFAGVRISFAELETLEEDRTEKAQAVKEAQAALGDAPTKEQEEALTKAKDELQQAQVDYDKSYEQFQNSIVALADERTPYKELGTLYAGLHDLRNGDLTAAEQKLMSLEWQGTQQIEPAVQFIGELATVALARGYLDNDETLSKGKSLLENVAENGSYAHISALTTLSLITSDGEEKAALEKRLASFSLDNPEQGELLETLMGRVQG